MLMAASIPCIRLTTSSSSASSCCSSSSPTLRFSVSHRRKPCLSFTTIRSAQAEGPLRRPVAPPLRQPSSSPPQTPLLQRPSPPSQPRAPPPPPPPTPPTPMAASAIVDEKSGITLEFQRAKAKELQEYFKQKKLEEADQGPAFGFVGKNEINNGRWAMFGFAVGMLTEYATGSDFVDQVKLILSNLGIVDLE